MSRVMLSTIFGFLHRVVRARRQPVAREGPLIIRNKATNGYLVANSTSRSTNISVTTDYNDGPETDWDLFRHRFSVKSR